MMQRLSDVKLFLPVSTKLILWYVFVIAYILIDLIFLVIVNCFDHGTSHFILFQVINYILPIILILDILISFNTGFIKNGKIILDRNAANRQYINTIYFYCDIIAFITSILQIIFQNTFMKQITVFHYLIFIKLTTAYFLDSLFKKYIIKSFNIALLYEVGKNFLVLAIVCHIIGSFYFYIDVLMYKHNWYSTSQLWIFNSYAYQNIYTSDFWVQYTYSYYVACVTLSGTAYGDIVPLNPHENLYIFCCFIFPMLIYSYVYSSIFQALFNRRTMTSKIRRYKFLAKQYLKSLGVSHKVMNKIITYLEFTHKKNMIVDTQFIEALSPKIKDQYLQNVMQGKFEFDCFNSIIQIAQVNIEYVKYHLTPLIRQQFFPQRFSLIDIGKLKIYHIASGIVVEVVKLNDTKKLSKPLPNSGHVAKTAFFTNQISLNKFSIESYNFVMGHSIQYNQFRKVLKQKMPSFNEAFCFVQQKIIDEKQYRLMNEKCYFCDDINHIIKDCPHLSIEDKSSERKNKQCKQQRRRFDRDQIAKSQSKKPRVQKKLSMIIQISNVFSESNRNQIKKSKKIYQRPEKNNEKFRNQIEKQKVKSYMQQTLNENFIEDSKTSLQTCRKIQLMEKVCIWDKFYPQRNITA